MNNYECPICASDIDDEYIEMCRSELNTIKAQAVRDAANEMLRRYTLEGNGDLCEVDYKLMMQRVNKIEKGEL